MQVVRGQNIYLQPFTSEHVESLCYFDWLNDIEVVRYLGREEYPGKFSIVDLRDYAKQMWESPYVSFFAVYAAGTDRFIGTAKINFLNEKLHKSGIADVGIMLGDRSCWGKGLGADVLRTASVYAFDKLRARKLTAGAYSLNTAVIRAFLKIGYKEEGRLRNQFFIGENDYCDHVLLGCLAHELIR